MSDPEPTPAPQSDQPAPVEYVPEPLPDAAWATHKRSEDPGDTERR